MTARQSGFSLLELLVVLFVVVVITSMVTLAVNTGNEDRKLSAEVDNLADGANFAEDEAQLSGRDYGLLLRRDFQDCQTAVSYSWRERRPEGWLSPDIAADVFEARQFDAGIDVILELEDLSAPPLAGDDEQRDETPQVIFYSSGETTPGSLVWTDARSGRVLWRADWDLLGRFDLLPGGVPLDEDGD